MTHTREQVMSQCWYLNNAGPRGIIHVRVCPTMANRTLTDGVASAVAHARHEHSLGETGVLNTE